MVTQYGIDEAMETVGELIKRIRHEKGISQKTLADRSGLGTSYISRLEASKGPQSITLVTARALAKGLGVPASVFLEAELEISDETKAIREARAKSGTEAPESKTLKDLLRTLGEHWQAEETFRVPIKGTVPAGCPRMEREESEEYFDLPVSYIEGMQRPYALRISGDSLVDIGIHDGEIVIVDPDAEILEGKTYIVRIGTECTAKRIHRQDASLLLVGANGTIEIKDPHDVENLGRVRAVFKLRQG